MSLARNPFPAPPSAREVSRRSVDGGIVNSGRGRTPPLRKPVRHPCGAMWASPPTEWPPIAVRRGGCPHPPAAPTGAEHPRGGLSKGIFRAPARGTFALGGKSTQKRRSNLRFENPCAPSPAAYLDRICHANAVPSKFHLNVALSLLLFPLPLLLRNAELCGSIFGV